MSDKETGEKAIAQARLVIENLKKAYAARPKNMPAKEEKKLLEIMAHAKELHDELKKIIKEG